MPAKKTAALKTAKPASRKTSDRKSGSAAKQRVAGGAAGAEEGGEAVVTIDRRRGARRNDAAEASPAPAAAAPLERRKKVQRRRQIDPTTCERDYSIEEVEFMNAMDDYKRKNGRMFPTCSEVLEVIRGLGYVRLSPAGKAMLAANDEATSAEDAAFEEELAAEVAY